jgi:alkylation response protein AidB-like acyl-CoA dehydrogenase
MDFSLSEEHLMIQRAARDFAQNECLPGVIERDEKQQFPREQLLKLAELGFMGMMVDPSLWWQRSRYGKLCAGYGRNFKDRCQCKRVHEREQQPGVLWHGSIRHRRTKRKYLTPLAQGLKDGELYTGAFLLSEPEAGSDASSQRTTAEDKGDHYLLNGTKNWITNGGTASVYLVIAQTDVSKGSRGINVFIVEKSWPGVVVGGKENKLGIRASDTHTILFNDVKVPKENKIGEEGFGFTFAMRTLAGGRIGIASQALGIASGAYELALNYSKTRKAFGTEIANHQAIAFKLADMATRIEASRLLCLKAAKDKDEKKDYTLSSSMAKVFASETAMWTATEAVQIHGGYGFVKEYHVERLMRDAKITQIYEGTSEVQRIVISRSILK